ncbi:hypothetical protein HDZ31DRAFT_38997 [Schizophyllum fasciatum]
MPSSNIPFITTPSACFLQKDVRRSTPCSPPSPAESVSLLSNYDSQPSPSTSDMRPVTVPRVCSPLNPDAPPSPLTPPLSPHPPFRGRHSLVNVSQVRIPSEDARVLSGETQPTGTLRASMILYHLPSTDDAMAASLRVPPSPARTPSPRCGTPSSAVSLSGESMLSYSSDSKYPSTTGEARGLIPYAYDPSTDDDPADPADALLHDVTDVARDPEDRTKRAKGLALPWRGMANVCALAALVSALLALFVLYPVLSYGLDGDRSWRIAHNAAINATGQAE